MQKKLRFAYISYDLQATSEQQSAKTQVEQLEIIIERLQPSREKSIAMTKLEECYMWIGKGIKEKQIYRDYVKDLNNKVEDK